MPKSAEDLLADIAGARRITREPRILAILDSMEEFLAQPPPETPDVGLPVELAPIKPGYVYVAYPEKRKNMTPEERAEARRVKKRIYMRSFMKEWRRARKEKRQHEGDENAE